MTATQEQQDRQERDRLAVQRLLEGLQMEQDRILAAWAPYLVPAVVLS